MPELPKHSKDVFKWNMLDCYVDLHNVLFRDGKYAILDQMPYAEFLRYNYLTPRKYSLENDYEPEELFDNLRKDNLTTSHNYSSVILVINSNENLKYSKIPRILQNHVPNKHTHSEKCFHYMMFMKRK